MPEWYAQLRNPILLLQSVLGVFVFAYSLNRRRPFVLRVILSTALGCVILIFVRAVFFPEMGTRVNSLGRVVMSALVFFLLALVCWSIYDESFWTALFVTSSGFAAQDMGGTFKTLLKLFPGMNALAQDKFGIILMDCISVSTRFCILRSAPLPGIGRKTSGIGARLFSPPSCSFLAWVWPGSPKGTLSEIKFLFLRKAYTKYCAAYLFF